MPFKIFGIQIGGPTPTYSGRVECVPTPRPAIPLTIDECATYADSLNWLDRLVRTKRQGAREPGAPWARSAAVQVARAVGSARVRGYQVYVPVDQAVLNLADHAVQIMMDLAPGAEESARFEALVMRMHTLAGMSAACGWALDPIEREAAWLGPEPTREGMPPGAEMYLGRS